MSATVRCMFDLALGNLEVGGGGRTVPHVQEANLLTTDGGNKNSLFPKIADTLCLNTYFKCTCDLK